MPTGTAAPLKLRRDLCLMRARDLPQCLRQRLRQRREALLKARLVRTVHASKQGFQLGGLWHHNGYSSPAITAQAAAMISIVPQALEDYRLAHTSPPDPLLAELAADMRAHCQLPQMLTGPKQCADWVGHRLALFA